MQEEISSINNTLKMADKEKEELNRKLYEQAAQLEDRLQKEKKQHADYKIIQKLEKEKKKIHKEIQQNNRLVNSKYPLIHKKHNYYPSALSREAYLSYKKGSKPWNEWSRQELLAYAPELKSLSTWLLRFHLLEQTSRHHIGSNHEFRLFYSLKKAQPFDGTLTFASCRRYVFKNNKRTCENLSGVLFDDKLITVNKRLFSRNKPSLFDWKICEDAKDFKNASSLLKLKEQIELRISSQQESEEWNDF